jgi:hypothetical protein
MEGLRKKDEKRRFFKESDSGAPYGQKGNDENDEATFIFSDLNRFGEERFRFLSPSGEFSDDDEPSYVNEYNLGEYPEQRPSPSLDVNYRGIGPKGYQAKRFKIIEDACEILARDKYLDASNIQVGLDNGVLVLRGEVLSRSDKKRAEALVENIPGIVDVANYLGIAPPQSSGWLTDFGSIEDEA